MSAEDELAIPEVPEAKPEDPEDVSWALSTAEAMWARGDHLEGIKWIRKAAEAASDAEDDMRALELAKTASDLTTLIARRSRASIGEGPGYAGGAPPEPGAPPALRYTSTQPMPPSAPSTAPSGAPAPVPAATKSAPPAAGRSAPPGPIPLPSRASNAPKAPQAPQPSQAPQGPHTPQPPRAAPRPLATNDARQGPQPGRGVLSNRTAPEAAPKSVRGRRRSRENLDAEAKQAGALDTAPHAVVDSATAERALRDPLDVTVAGIPIEVPSPTARSRRRSRPEPDPTVVTTLEALVEAERRKSTAEWDASPTQNLSGDEMENNIDAGDRATTAFAFPAADHGARPSPSAPPPAPRPPASTVHDPGIQTSQAVRVVVWRDANGVHIAPAGTVVSAITIDAVLVALEPTADLTAWLSKRER